MRTWILIALIGVAAPFCFMGVVRAESPDDQKITRFLAAIDRASEGGDFSSLQTLRMQLADFAGLIGRYDLASRQYEMLLAGRPGRADRVRYFTRLGNTRMALKDYGRAIEAFDDALHDNPKDWEANIQRARAFSAADLSQRAIESYLRCIKLKPDAVVPYEELADVYQKQGFLSNAIAYYEKALAREPKPEIYLHMADCYVHMKNVTQAMAILGQAKVRLPRADYDVRLGDIYQSLGDLSHAGLAWEEAIKADPKRDDVRLKLTMIYDQLHRRPETDRLFKNLIETYPQSPLVHYFKAMVLWGRGERTAARSEALFVQSLAPTEEVAHFNDLLLSELRKKST